MKTEKCFLRESDGTYTEITYENLLRLEDYRSRFFLPLDGGLLEVPEDVYRYFNRAERRERYLREEEKRAGGVLSMDTETCSLHEILADANVNVELAALDDLMLEQLQEVLDSLPEDDFALIQALYFEGKSEVQVARELKISQQAVSQRKHKILERLKKLF